MQRESKKARRERAGRIFELLEGEYPEASTALNHTESVSAGCRHDPLCPVHG